VQYLCNQFNKIARGILNLVYSLMVPKPLWIIPFMRYLYIDNYKMLLYWDQNALKNRTNEFIFILFDPIMFLNEDLNLLISLF